MVHDSAIRSEHLTGHETGRIGREEEHRSRDIFGPALTREEHMPLDEIDFSGRHDLSRALAEDETGQNGVAADIMMSELGCDIAGHTNFVSASAKTDQRTLRWTFVGKPSVGIRHKRSSRRGWQAADSESRKSGGPREVKRGGLSTFVSVVVGGAKCEVGDHARVDGHPVDHMPFGRKAVAEVAQAIQGHAFIQRDIQQTRVFRIDAS
jgi:hypothetical protein